MARYTKIYNDLERRRKHRVHESAVARLMKSRRIVAAILQDRQRLM